MELARGAPLPLGASPCKEGVNFAVHAKDAEKLAICIFDNQDPSKKLAEYPLDPGQHKLGTVWHAQIKGAPEQFIYGYKIKNNGQEEEYLLLDPYAICVASEDYWHDQPAQENNYRPLGRYIGRQDFDWQDDKHPCIPMEDLIIYEMHVRGFTKHASSQSSAPGTFKGMIAKIPYLKELGVNAVELLPIFEFNEEETMHANPQTKQKLHNYFGYSTVNFFAPMARYASENGAKAIDEFKLLVRELHKNGIEVILDVVFNHTFEGNEKGPVQSFKGLDALAYYMINGDGNYLNFSGCGNTMNGNHPVTREFILAALRYWVSEMHVDGFRFDLASILNRAADGTPLPNAPVVEAISFDPLLADTKLIAEAWDPGGLYQVGGFAPLTQRWSEWNGKYRDIVRRYVKGTPGQRSLFAGAISGSHELYGVHNRSPNSSVNFIIAHDGFSLADLVSYNDKHNDDNGEENRDGMNENESWNCGFEGATQNKKVLNLRKKQMRNYHMALMVSLGVPMILMGDEYGHTRNGNNNTWCQDNELNWFLWHKIEENKEFFRFYKQLIHYRKNHPLLRRANFFSEKDVKWHGLEPEEPNWDHENHLVAYSLYYPNEEIGLYIAFNAAHVYHTVKLPSPGEGKYWRWIVNTGNPSPQDIFEEQNIRKVEGDTIRMAPYSSLMLAAAS